MTGAAGETARSEQPTPMEETVEKSSEAAIKEGDSSGVTQAAGDANQIESSVNKEPEEATIVDDAMLQTAAAEALSTAAVKAKVYMKR